MRSLKLSTRLLIACSLLAGGATGCVTSPSASGQPLADCTGECGEVADGLAQECGESCDPLGNPERFPCLTGDGAECGEPCADGDEGCVDGTRGGGSGGFGSCLTGTCRKPECQVCSACDAAPDYYRRACPPKRGPVCVFPLPRELDKVTLPRHVIEPPDVLLIEAVDHLRPESAPMRAGDTLIVQVANTLPVDPDAGQLEQQFKIINGRYTIGVDGVIDFGPEYGRLRVDGMPLKDIRTQIDTHLRTILKNPQLYVASADTQAKQLVAGEHTVHPDGTVSLGIYGSVYVTGLTVDQARQQIQEHLRPHIHNPQVNVDVAASHSKFYYVIADGGGAGEKVVRLPCTGNETVLDAIAQVEGLPAVASTGDIWVARPAPAGTGCDQVLRVEWDAIARGAVTDTNYQLLPGDRLYVKADNKVIFDTWVSKLSAPWKRLFGFTVLGAGPVPASPR